MSEQYKRNPNISCLICGREIYRRPVEIKKNNGRAYCSAECYGKSCRKEIPCLVCGKPILSGLNKKTCSRACSNKNRRGIKYKINSPRDKAKTHRLLKTRLFKIRGNKCEECRFGKYEILQIHHKDNNKNNNNIDNLEIICPNCHCEKHYLDRSLIKR